MKTRIEELRNLANSMSELKCDYTRRGVEMFNDYKYRCEALISELRSQGVDESTHPRFKNAVSSFKYWSK